VVDGNSSSSSSTGASVCEVLPRLAPDLEARLKGAGCSSGSLLLTARRGGSLSRRVLFLRASLAAGSSSRSSSLGTMAGVVVLRCDGLLAVRLTVPVAPSILPLSLGLYSIPCSFLA
jgi:hypothetical protein